MLPVAATSSTAATLAGIGGDAFALFYSAKDQKVHCLQGNGAAPAGLSLAAVRAAGIPGKELPPHSPLAVSVPGGCRPHLKKRRHQRHPT